MIKTRGLTHIHLMVRDLQRSLSFYQTVFGMKERFRAGGELVFLNTPGSNDVFALHQAAENEPTGVNGSILHFGLQLVNKSELDVAIAEVEAAGGTMNKRGEFAPGIPFAYVADPDGYEIELS